MHFKKSFIATIVATACGVAAAQNITQGAGFSGGTGATNNSGNGIAIGLNAVLNTTTGPQGDMPDIVIGANASSTGSRGVLGPTGLPISGGPNAVVGSGAHADNAAAATVFGTGARVGKPDGSFIINGSAFGIDAAVLGDGGTALGVGTRAGGNGTAVGQNAEALAAGSIAIGICNNLACSNDPVTGQFIRNSIPNGADSIAIGSSSRSGGNASVALGSGASTPGANAMAMGVGSYSAGTNSVALGQYSVANTDNSVALGANTSTTRANSVAVGGRQITDVAAGTAGTDAVNVDQLNQGVASAVGQANAYTNQQLTNGTVNANFATVTAGGLTINPGSNIDMGGNIVHNIAAGVAGTDAVNVDQLNSAVTNIGNQANTYADAKTKYFQANSTGSAASATGTDSVAIGPGTVTSGNSAIAGGLNATANADDTVVFGANSTGSAVGAVAVGSGSTSSGAGAVAMGQGAGATMAGSLALGQGAQATTANSVALGANATTADAVATAGGTINGKAYTFAGAAPVGVVSVGSAGAERQVTNVAAGQLSATSTDAVNGSQLYATNVAVDRLGSTVTNLGNSTATNFGGGSTYDPNTGVVTAPAYTVNSVTYNNVGSAINAIGGTITQNNSGSLPPASATGSNSVAIGAGSNATRDNSVDFGGRQLTGIAPGTQDGDASTMGQLRQATANSQGYTDRAIATLDARAQKMMSGIGAMAMASSALQPNARAEGNTSVSAAVGTYNGESAIAAGVNYYLSNQVLLNARIGVTTAGPAKVGAAVGVTWGF